MMVLSSVFIILAVGSTVECVRNTPRSTRASRNEASLEFECPEEFGYYPHPRDCTQYYVCVFGGALLESCTGGLMYSHELQTCDWPRNVGCLAGGSIAKETEEDDPLLERAAKVETIQLQHQQHHQQQQNQRSESRQHQRQPVQRQQQASVTPAPQPISQITERQSRQRQSQQQQHQQQQHQRTYQDDEYEPATEIESDRQQRVYRGQPSTIGQVQRDRDGLRRNIISVSHPTSSSLSSGLAVTPRNIASSNSNVVNQGSGRRDRYDSGQQNDFDPNPTPDPAPRRSRIQASSIDIINPDYHRVSYSEAPRERELDEVLDEWVTRDKDSSTTVIVLADPTTLHPQSKNQPDQDHSNKSSVDRARVIASLTGSDTQSRSAFPPVGQEDDRIITVTSNGQSTIQRLPLSDESAFSSSSSTAPQLQRNEELERNEISVTTSSASVGGSNDGLTSEAIDEAQETGRPARLSTSRNPQQRQHSGDEFFANPSSPSWLRSTEDVERNEISVTPGPAGRGFMVKRLRADHQDSVEDKDFPVTPAYARQRSTTPEAAQHERGESRTLEVSVSPPAPRQRSRNNLIPSPFQPRTTDKSAKLTEIDPDSQTTVASARRSHSADPDNRKYYLASVPQRPSASNLEIDEVSGSPIQRRVNEDSRTRRPKVDPMDKKYYIPSVQQRRFSDDQERRTTTENPETTKMPLTPPSSTLRTTTPDVRNPFVGSNLKTSTENNLEKETQRTNNPEDTAKNEITLSPTTSTRRNSGLTALTGNPNGPEGNEIPNLSVGARTRQRPVNRGQARHKTQDGNRRNSTPEREKDSVVNSRGQTESHYRTISSESPRIAKTTASTAAPISKVYYSDADQSYPYYTIYDDDVSIYKDDSADYGQYAVNRTVQIPQQHQQQQQQQAQPNHHQHRQQNVRIAEVTPNSNQYSQKPKKVSDSNKYNLSPEVTVSDYDIYDSEPLKNTYRISDGQQPLRTNGLSHPVVHVTTPNAIVDNYVPLTTTTQPPPPPPPPPPPTTTARPYTATVQTRVRAQVNRGTAPPRLRPTLKPSTAIVSKAQEFVDIYRHPAVRPPPIYPTPTVDKPAAKCRKDVCLLPDCSCGGTDIPGDYLPEEVPQIVLLTFDDSVNDLNKQLYADLFEKGRKNPNGCPISATFYVSHEWTDYSQVQNLYATGHEIASHTVSHSFGEQFSARKWGREIAGQREILAAYGGVKLEDVRGMRAPFLSVGGNNMFKMLWDTNFTYDSSMPIYENRPPSWPYTLDYKLFHDCMIPPCPTRSYPGLWEVPMVMWQDLNGGRCSMGDACSNPPTPDGVYKMLIKNFERHYTTNRAPFGLFYHAAWFTQPHHKEGFMSFLDTIVAMDDVWVVTNWQALQWIRNPTPIGALDRFEPFGCNYPDRPKKCNNAKVCNLWHKSGVRYMKTCQACPDIYPWTGKTGIRSSRIDNEVEN